MSIFSKRSVKGEDYIKQKYGRDVHAVPSLNSQVEGMYSVYDKVCQEYNPPFVCKNLATAIRNMKDSLKDTRQSIIAMHPEDYLLVEIGYFDKALGLLLPSDPGSPVVSYELSKLFVNSNEVVEDKRGETVEISK